MTNLVIVESPTKAKTLSGILGKEYNIKASMGHIRDLPKKGLGVDLEHDFQPEYEIPEKAKKTSAELQKLGKDATKIILATDPDREGEAIAWHLSEILKGKTPKKKSSSAKTSKTSAAKKKVTEETPSEELTVNDNALFERVVFHELTKSAVLEAFSHPSKLNLNLVDAQQARRILDRLVGYKLSPLLWKKVRYGLSAGRVQSVAVRLVVERERERLAFNPEEYWSIEGDFKTEDARYLKAALSEYKSKKLEIKGGDEAKRIQSELQNDSFKISAVKKTERQRKPYAPFKTSTLQQAAANVFGFTAKRTMIAAQKLFEEGHITYHRTDSLNLSPQFVEIAREFISAQMGKKYLPDTSVNYKTTTKNAQEAHEAIRPTALKTDIEAAGFTGDEVKVYSLIWKRALESQMLPAIYDQTSISIESDKGYVFKASGSVVKFDGWLAVGKLIDINVDEEALNKLPEFVVDEKMLLEKLTLEQHFTQPPARYSDATLIKALEEIGVGRPSTYAPTISTIIERGYVARENKYFAPQDVAYVVVDLLVNNFKEIIDYQFTAQMEEELDEIAEGNKKWVPVIKAFYEPFEKNLVEKDKILQKSEVTNLGETDEKCPECSKPLVIKLGKFGKFLSCSGYPDCKFAKPIADKLYDENGDPKAEEVVDYGKCTNCEDGVFVLKQGRFGKFFACSNYPKCKTTKKYLEKIGMKCPKCPDGEVIVKKARGKIFYGCSRYPDCDYSSWKNPLQKTDGDIDTKDGASSETI